MMIRIGLILNPLAGVGGPLALKGSDGSLAAQAIANGARSQAQTRALPLLTELASLPQDSIRLLTCAGPMGADACRLAGLTPEIIHTPQGALTQPGDTLAACKAMCAANADIIVFAGGDGTARDILSGLEGHDRPVLGIPCGVKMHSAVFATTPRTAAHLLRETVESGLARTRLSPADIVDRDANGVPRLFGVLTALDHPLWRQAAKSSGGPDEDAALAGACLAVADELRSAPLALVGPGSTTMRVKSCLGGGGTLLGVDLYAYGALISADANERGILARMADDAVLVLGVTGGQGFLLGRGNQQISAEVLRRIPRSRVCILASAAKLAALHPPRLLVDTGDPALDAALAGYIPVRTGARRTTMIRIGD